MLTGKKVILPFRAKHEVKLLAVCALIFGGITSARISGQILPPDVAKVTSASTPALSFANWFKNNDPMTLNAEVLPADSLHFPDTPNGDFYRWSYQMYLWLLSPSKSTYGGTGLVLSSPEFYNVSPPDPTTGLRTLSANRVSPFRNLSALAAATLARRLPTPEPMGLDLRVANLGPNGLPFIKTRDGRFLEVLPVARSVRGLPLIQVAQKSTEVSRARLVRRGSLNRIEFFDIAGKAVALQRVLPESRFKRMFTPRARAVATLNPKNFVFKLDANSAIRLGLGRMPIFVLRDGTIINPEVAQSDGQAQLTQSGSLIYYGIMVNDVYAYYLTGQKSGAIAGNKFPVNAANLAAITSFATAHGHTLLNPNALAVEIKSSWVEATAVADPAQYVTMSARVPLYDRTDPAHWVQTGSKIAKVALVGLHVVGSSFGHPEMIWASFEHVGNTANVAYTYDRASPPGGTALRVADPVGGGAAWLFTGVQSPAFPFLSHAAGGGANDLVPGEAGGAVGPTSVLRMAPWGAPNNHKPNPLSTVSRSNAEIISLNRDVRAQMSAGDVRNNYLFLGATWTVGGAAPTSNFNTSIAQNIVGTNHLANSTMETFTQSSTFTNGGSFPGPGCLACHRDNTTDTSHIYSDIKPLF